MAAAALMLLALLATPRPGGAYSSVPRDVDEMVAEADQILVGTVVGVRGTRLPGGALGSEVTLAASRVLKGDAVGSRLVLVVLGGELDGERLTVSGVPEFKLGSTYLVFVKGNGRTIFPVVGGEHGLFEVRRDLASGEQVLLDARGRPIARPEVRRALGAGSASGVAPGRIRLGSAIEAILDRLP